MSINFTGINNIKILKKNYDAFGTYKSVHNNLKQGNKQYTEMKISAKLTDDETGNHLSDYMKRTPQYFINKERPDTIDFYIKRFDAEDEPVSQSMFKLNDKELIINSDKKLPLMTFLARFTRESGNNPKLSMKQQIYMKLANESIAKETTEYIETK